MVGGDGGGDGVSGGVSASGVGRVFVMVSVNAMNEEMVVVSDEVG